MKRWVSEKLDRLRGGERPRVLDLFSGCGGMSLGCELAGAELIGGVDIDPASAKTYQQNLHSSEQADRLGIYSAPRDITQTEPGELVRLFRPKASVNRAVDVIVGGPPCQAFARVGRAKLREIMHHPEAFLRDPRAKLYQQVIAYVQRLVPVAVILENVPDVLNYGGTNLFEAISAALEKLGYETRYGLLNAVHYGVPQMRDRCFLIGINRLVGVEPTLPAPTHRWSLPRGYQGTRNVALKGIDLFSTSHYVSPRPGRGKLETAITAQDAIGDLPSITLHLRGETKKEPQRLDRPVRLPDSPAANAFVRLMRSWPRHESNGSVSDHVIRFLPRDYAIFARMRPGDQYPEAYQWALRVRDEEAEMLASALGRQLRKKEYESVTRNCVPPYDPGKFPNKWRKMEANAPARTLMAHLGKDTYSHIHYDSTQARPISVREAARLQSFPDGFRFAGTMNPAFRQIGNAVPPLLAYAVIAEAIATIRNVGASEGGCLVSQSSASG